MNKPRRGSAGLAIGGGGFAYLLSQTGLLSGELTQGHWLALAGSLAIALVPYVTEKLFDWLHARTGIDLADTQQAIRQATADGVVTRAEIKSTAGAAIDDVYDHLGSGGPEAEDIDD